MKRLVLIAVLVIMAIAASAASAQGDYPGYTGCGYAPFPRLVPGGMGRVTPGLPNILRSQPYRGSSSYILGEIPAGATFTVLAGYAAQCGDGMWWYYVSYNNIAGWTPEGSATGEYWTEPTNGGPLPPPPPPQGCALSPRLVTGGYGRVTPGLPNLIRTQPYRGWGSTIVGMIPAGATFYVQGGVSCDGSINWWQVTYNGVTGWTGEGENGLYWVEPSNSNPPPQGCPLPQRLIGGRYGRVTPGLPNLIRSQPYRGSGSATLGSIPAGAIFYVHGSVSCNGGINWWQVSYNGVTGWTGEGENGFYWVEPI